ncbi:MAG: Lrp/AsnC family transcriptional regulator [Sphingomonadales bacterium]|nr:Lrp/AsnC family transcriptional regulator [Sphingomonadales bacterium]MDE2170610.1 Lrp/AsnC family transcriptional regulator [Sphingomonadales bacterium]
MSLDRLDREILRILQVDGRISNQDLAARVGMSPSACLRRVRLLESSGVIQGYGARLAMAEEAEATVVIVRITLERQTEEYLRRFEHAVRQYPEIKECYLMTGEVDYTMRVSTGGAADYEHIHTHILSRLPGIARIHSSVAMRNVLRVPAPR